MVNLKFSKKKIVQNEKLKLSKNPKRSFVRTIEKKIQEKFESFRLRFVEE